MLLKQWLLAFSMFFSTFISSSPLYSQTLTEIQLYKRCYNHLLQRPIPLNDTRAVQIKNGLLKATQACTELLTSAELTAEGNLRTQNTESLSILKTFTAFHKSFFQINNVEQIPDYSIELNRGTEDAYDPSEPALTMTFNLLRNEPIKNILNYNTGFRAIRVNDPKKSFIAGFGSEPAPLLGSRRFGTPNNGIIHMRSRSVAGANGQLIKIPFLFMEQPIDLAQFFPGLFPPDSSIYQRPNSDISEMPFIQSGEVIGVRPTSEVFQVQNIELIPGSDYNLMRPGDLEPNLEYQFNFFRTFGGGILGAPVFYLMNYGHNLGVKSNGTTKLPRRWSRSLYESFLCLSFPNLRETDITSYLDVNSPTPFRTQKSCLQCHGTLDHAAMTARNIVTGSMDALDLSFNSFQFTKFPMVVTKYQVTQDQGNVWPTAADPQFHTKSPAGRILYRAHNGQLINQTVSNLADLGKRLSETDDFYSCAAKRYFEYFTGKGVPLYDRSDPRNAELNRKLNNSQIRDRKTVEALGKNLKQHQSLKKLVAEIIETDIYRDENYDPK